ncbi:VanZ family protein [Paenibacillus sp. NPDC058071]|uniref:VanZ family protein n=1 Tax=Paenibacillus sp. NPDC058071 TaxID=3346326 RepID=UPI0036DBC0DA
MAKDTARVSFIFRVTAFLLFLIYLYLLLKLVLFRGITPHAFVERLADVNVERLSRGIQYISNFIPFRTIWNYIAHHSNRFVAFYNVVGNVAAFMPFGYLLPLLLPSQFRALRIAAASFLFSLLLECLQLLGAVGSFDVDDLILNTAGGVLGYWLLQGLRQARALLSGKRKTKPYQS